MGSERSEYSVDFVKLESGNIPFNIFLDSLSKLERTEVLALIEEFRLSKSKGENLPAKMSGFLKDKIFELRTKHENRISRSLYFFTVGKVIVFTHGFIKKTEKTPTNEIDKAIKYRNIYLEDLNYGK
jgi:phage-related protein